MEAKTDSTAERAISPWYEKELKMNESTGPPTGFDIRTKRTDITKENFLQAIDNSSVPQEALMCYATFVFESIRRNKGESECFAPILEVKSVGESLLRLVYGQTRPSRMYRPSVIKRALNSKRKSTQQILHSIFEGNPNDQDHLHYITRAVLLSADQDKIDSSLARLRDVANNRGDAYKDLLSERPNIRNLLVEYCVKVLHLYGKTFDTPFLFKVRGTPAFLVDLHGFFDNEYFPSNETLDRMFEEKRI